MCEGINGTGPKVITGLTVCLSGQVQLGACIQASGRLDIIDTRLHASRGTVAIKLHKLKNGNDPVVHMRGGSIELEDDARLAAAEGPGVLELHQVAVNGVVKDHRYVFDKDGKK